MTDLLPRLVYMRYYEASEPTSRKVVAAKGSYTYLLYYVLPRYLVPYLEDLTLFYKLSTPQGYLV